MRTPRTLSTAALVPADRSGPPNGGRPYDAPVTVLTAAGSATELAVAADSLTYALEFDPPVLEHEDQPKVLALGGRLAIGTYGTEYLIDPERFDVNAIVAGEDAVDSFDAERTQLRRHERAGQTSIGEFAYLWWTGHYGKPRIQLPGSAASCHIALSEFIANRFVAELAIATELQIPVPEIARTMVLTLGFEGDAPVAALATITRERDQINAESGEIQLNEESGFAVWSGANDASWASDALSGAETPPEAAITAAGFAIAADRDGDAPAPSGGRIRCAAVTPEGARFVETPEPDVPELPPFPDPPAS